MSHPPDPKMRRGGPPQATPESTQPQHYHTSPDVQAFIALLALLAPLFLVLLLLAVAGGRQ
jgi:hypothetical protein